MLADFWKYRRLSKYSPLAKAAHPYFIDFRASSAFLWQSYSSLPLIGEFK
jgi:hypothetical protein